MDRMEEIKHHEDAIHGRGEPSLSAPATLGRLAQFYLELYLEMPDARLPKNARA